MATPDSGGVPIKAEQDSDGTAQSTADMTAFVQNLLTQMCSLDEMGARIGELEQSINDLKGEMGIEGMSPTKTNDEESKPADSSA